MPELALVTCGGPSAGAGALRAAAAAKGLETTMIDASAGLPHFDARPEAGYPASVASLRADCRRAGAFVFALRATPGGCPGAVLNLLQLLGGPAYDTGERAAPLAGRPVVLRVAGSLPHALLALEQLQAAVTALGGVVAGQSTAPAGEADEGDWVPGALGALQRLPGVAVMPPPVDLGLGHVHLPLPGVVVEALREEASGISLYAPQRGLPRLRRAVAARMGLAGGAEDVLVTIGASGALTASLAAHLRPGDGVLVPDPGFPNYRPIVEARGLRVVPYRLAAGHAFLPDMDELAALAVQARAIIWNFPHNPTGAVAPRPLVERLVALADRHDLLILSDEVYTDMVWDGGEHVSPSAVGGRARTVVMGSCSKTFAMAGHRIGWAAAPADLLAPARRVHWAEHMSPPTLGQQAASAAIAAIDDVLPPLRSTLLASRAAALRELEGCGLVDFVPRGAFYLWLDIRAARMSPADYASGLVREAAVTVMPGEAFGAGGAQRVRVSFAADPVAVASGCSRLRAFHDGHTT